MVPAQKLGKYEILEELGRGGFASVYKARDTHLDRIVALKVLHPYWSNDPGFATRFEREARAVAALHHPHIATVYDADEADGQLFIAMAYLPGSTLRSLLETEGPLPLARAVPILRQLAQALDYAHGQGMIHRDVKPGNVIVTDTGQGPQATLLDFGLVRALAESSILTSQGTLLGSPEYMAPEQADPNRAAELGPATDRYALGVVAYHMLTGRVPFPGNTPGTLNAHEHKPVPPPRDLRPDLPQPVAEALLKMLAKAPTDRYPSATAFVAELEQTLQADRQRRQREAQLAPLYQRLQNAVVEQNWAEALVLGGQIQAQDPTYRDVADLLTQARQHLQQPRPAAPTLPALPGWAWRVAGLLIFLIGLTGLGLWAFGGGQETGSPTATLGVEIIESATPTFSPVSTNTPLSPLPTATSQILTPAPTEPPTSAPADAQPFLTPTSIQTTEATPTATLTPPIPQAISSISANIRFGPGTNYPVIGTLQPNSPLKVTGRNEQQTWWQVQLADDTVGWIADSVVDARNTNGIPVVQSPPLPTPSLGIGSTEVRAADEMTMVYVPAGSFQMGSVDSDSKADDDEKPQHPVTLDAFWLDRTEVTNAHYARCVAAGVCAEPTWADDSRYNGTDYPVVGVAWQDAADYCQWAGGRLPTEAEWEYAARGPEQPVYPWGDTFDGSRTNADGSGDGYERTAPVGSFPAGASWVGALDMAGNVWEWVDDWYDGYPGTTYQSDFGTTYKVLRGGSWFSDASDLRAAHRSHDQPVNRYNGVGFRCVVSPGN